MNIADISVLQNKLQIQSSPYVTRGCVGATVTFLRFSREWEGLSKTAVFRTQRESRDVVNIQAGTPVVIPWEVLEAINDELMVGVLGTNADGSYEIHTDWEVLGKIQTSAISSGKPSQPPSPDWTAQIESQVNHAVEEVQSFRPTAVQILEAAGQTREAAHQAAEYASAARGSQEASDSHRRDAIRAAQHTDQILSEVQGLLSDTVAAATTASNKALAAAACSENARSQADRAKAEADHAEENARSLIDDAAISTGKTLSSRGILDRFCPAFEAAGSTVVCSPAGDWPVSLCSDLGPMQSGSGTPGPDNARRFIPWQEAEFRSYNINICPSDADTLTKSGITMTANGDGTYFFNGTASETVSFQFIKPRDERISLPVGDWHLSIVDAGHKDEYAVAALHGYSWASTAETRDLFIRKEEMNYYNLFYIQFEKGQTPRNLYVRPLIVPLSHAYASYAPCSCKTCTAQLPEPMYGCTVDWTGSVRNTFGLLRCSGSESWTREDGPQGASYSMQLPLPARSGTASHALCSHGVLSTGPNSARPGEFYISEDNRVHFLRPDIADPRKDASGWKDWLKAHPMELCYDLLSPGAAVPLHVSGKFHPVPGVNILYTADGVIHISGKEDPISIFEQLQAQITNLQKAFWG